MRYLPLTDAQRKEMLSTLGMSSPLEPFERVAGKSIHRDAWNLPKAQSEYEIINTLGNIGQKNVRFPLNRLFAGAGAYSHHVPVVVDQITNRGEFLTAYTPYQPEISQGTLQSIYEFQTMMTRILGTGFCNASHYDGATAAAEACLMALRLQKDRDSVCLVGRIHPTVQKVIHTYFSHMDGAISTAVNEAALHKMPAEKLAAIVIQQPDSFGMVGSLDSLASWAKDRGVLLVVVNLDPTAFGIFAPPSQADIIAGDATCLGNPVQFGGPYLGYLAGKIDFVRQAPGRLIGKTTDSRGRQVFTITLATREQHIRREKATSNICTSAGLCLVRAAIHLSLLGKSGFRTLSQNVYSVGQRFKQRAIKNHIAFGDDGVHFREFCLHVSGDAERVVQGGVRDGILLGVPLKRIQPQAQANELLVSMNETMTDDDLDHWIRTYQRAVYDQ